MTIESFMALWIVAALIVYALWSRWATGYERRKRQELRRLAGMIRGRESMRDWK